MIDKIHDLCLRLVFLVLAFHSQSVFLLNFFLWIFWDEKRRDATDPWMQL